MFSFSLEGKKKKQLDIFHVHVHNNTLSSCLFPLRMLYNVLEVQCIVSKKNFSPHLLISPFLCMHAFVTFFLRSTLLLSFSSSSSRSIPRYLSRRYIFSFVSLLDIYFMLLLLLNIHEFSLPPFLFSYGFFLSERICLLSYFTNTIITLSVVSLDIPWEMEERKNERNETKLTFFCTKMQVKRNAKISM